MMRSLLSACLVWLMSPTAALLAQHYRPIPQDPVRQEQRHKEMLEWNRSTLGEPYLRVGKFQLIPSSAAQKCLAEAARYFSHVVEPYTSLVNVHAQAQQAIEGGCRDPLILYLYARSSYGRVDPGPEERARRYQAAADGMRDSGYPAVRRFMALYMGGCALAELPEHEKEAEQYLMDSLQVVAESAQEESPTRDLQDAWFTAVRTIQRTLGKLDRNSFIAYQRVDAKLEKTPALRVVRLQLRGSFYIDYAWDARGDNSVNAINTEAWAKFKSRFEVARDALESAWKLKPDESRTAALMLHVAKGLKFDRAEMEKWFDRAMKADGDNKEACAAKLEWLDPKWHGTIEDMVAFGWACRDTKNTRSGIPLLLAEAYLRVLPKLPEKEQPQYMRSERIWRDVFQVFSKHLEMFSDDDAVRTQFAICCYWCGHYVESHMQFLVLENRFKPTAGYSEETIKKIRDFVIKIPIPGMKRATANKPAASQASPSASPDRTKEFTSEKCRYTLPGSDWSWQAAPAGATLCSASNKKGYVLTLPVVKLQEPQHMDTNWAAEFEKGYLKNGNGPITKRGGRFVTFQGLSSYEIDATFADGRTTVSRFLQANRYGYYLTLVGGRKPIERDPEFEKIMNGFSFAVPPEPNWSVDVVDERSRALARKLGEGLGAVLFAVLLIGPIAWSASKKRAAAKKPEDEAMPIKLGSLGKQTPPDDPTRRLK